MYVRRFGATITKRQQIVGPLVSETVAIESKSILCLLHFGKIEEMTLWEHTGGLEPIGTHHLALTAAQKITRYPLAQGKCLSRSPNHSFSFWDVVWYNLNSIRKGSTMPDHGSPGKGTCRWCCQHLADHVTLPCFQSSLCVGLIFFFIQ